MINNNICITGVTASGKSTVCNELSNLFPEVNYFIKSQKILSIAKREFGINHQDQIKKLHKKNLDYLFGIVEKEICTELCQAIIYLIDDHIRVLSNSGCWIEAHDRYTNIHRIGCYILLSPSPERVLKNQENEKKVRYRCSRSISEIKGEQIALKRILFRWNKIFSFDFHIIFENEFSQIIKISKRILKEWINKIH